MKEKPIYVIEMLEKDGSQNYIYESGIDSGFPDFGCTNNVGFYYNKEEAVKSLNYNACGIDERCYNYAVLKTIYPGLYQSDISERKFYKWDNEREGFFEMEEPENCKIIAFGL